MTSPLSRFYRSTIGMKWVMAVSGLILLGFVVAHLLGNLKMFVGRDSVNEYAVWLRHLPFFGLWLLRGVTLLAVVLHVATALRLVHLNRAARPDGYRYRSTIQTTYAARTMPVTGMLVLAYVVYHLLHFTFGATHPEHAHLTDAAGRHDVYSMVVLGFRIPAVAAVYVIANAILAVHLSHGIGSLFQTVGVGNPRYHRLLDRAGPAIAGALFLGYVSIPIAVMLDILKLPEGVQ